MLSYFCAILINIVKCFNRFTIRFFIFFKCYFFFDREKERKKLEEEERRESCSRPGTPEDDDPGGGGNSSGVPNGISPRKLHKKFGKWGGLEGGPSRFG